MFHEKKTFSLVSPPPASLLSVTQRQDVTDFFPPPDLTPRRVRGERSAGTGNSHLQRVSRIATQMLTAHEGYSSTQSLERGTFLNDISRSLLASSRERKTLSSRNKTEPDFVRGREKPSLSSSGCPRATQIGCTARLFVWSWRCVWSKGCLAMRSCSCHASCCAKSSCSLLNLSTDAFY